MASTSQIRSALNLFAHPLFTVTVVYFYLSFIHIFGDFIFSLHVVILFYILLVRQANIFSFQNRKKIMLKQNMVSWYTTYWGADKSLALPGRKKARQHVRDVRDFNNIETRARSIIKFFSARQGAEGNPRHSDRKKKLASFLVGLRSYQHPCSIIIISKNNYHFMLYNVS